MSVKLALPVALLAVLSLSACGDDEPSSGSDDRSTESTTDATTEATEETTDATEATTEASETTDAPAAPAGDLTAPGSELAIGDVATVPVTYGSKGTGTVEVKVVGIKKGTVADLQAAKVKDAADYTPYYINLELKLVSVGPDGLGGYNPGSDFDGLTGNQKAGSLIVIGDFTPCENDDFDSDAPVGTVLKSCVPALTTKGSTVDGVQFVGGGDDSPYDQFDGQPVFWK